MIPGLGSAHASAVDAFINKLCRTPADFRELHQLRHLFTWRFRRGLERLINGTLHRTGRPAVCDVEIGWIDKIPMAEASTLSRRTEIGDAILFCFDESRDKKGNLVTNYARAAILQAKVTDTVGQLAAPTVPVTNSPSSPNELELLSNWPVFELFDTSASSRPSLLGVTVSQSLSRPAPHGWFIAAPGEAPRATSTWPCWWMAGEALNGAACTTTFGHLLVSFLSPPGAGPQVGAPFSSRGLGTPNSLLLSPADWSDLCNHIRKILRRYRAPRSVFNMGPRVYGPVYPRVYSVSHFGAALLHRGPAGLASLQRCAAGISDDVSLRHGSDPFRPIRRGGPIIPYVEEPGMFVVTVRITSLQEGREG
jgi:hypothetical protein